MQRSEAEAVVTEVNAKLLSGNYHLEAMIDGEYRPIDGKLVATDLLGYFRPVAIDNQGGHFLTFELVHNPINPGF